MTKTAQSIADNVATGPVKFYVRKTAVAPMLAAIAALSERDDLSGKFARKVGQNRRALSAADESIREERKDLVKHHAEVFPAVDADGNPHPQAGEPTPVYFEQNGVPVFKKDKAGNDTDERIVVPDQFNIADPMAFQKDMVAMGKEWIVVSCPGFKQEEFEAFKKIAPKIVDPLMDLEVGGPSTKKPADFEEEAPALALVKEETNPSVADESAVDGDDRGAP